MLDIFVKRVRTEEDFSFEDYKKIKKYINENMIELYFIVKNQPSQELLDFVIEYKKNKIRDLEENPSEIHQLAFTEIGEIFLNKLIRFLEEKKNNKEKMPLDFEGFVEEFSKFYE